jgi:hypothetical protein
MPGLTGFPKFSQSTKKESDAKTHRTPKRYAREIENRQSAIENKITARGEIRTPDQPRKLSGLLYRCK